MTAKARLLVVEYARESARAQRKRERRELKRAAKRARRREREEQAAVCRATEAKGDACSADAPALSSDELVSSADGGQPVQHMALSVVLESAHACAQGPRLTMEDEFICEDDVLARSSKPVAGTAGRLQHATRTPCSMYAVLDGHGGDRAAKIGKRVLFAAVRDKLRAKSPAPVDGSVSASASPGSDGAEDDVETARQALLFAFDEAETQIEALARRGSWIDGSTACCALIVGGVLAVANLGDSRAVLGRAGGRTLALSVDHKPDDAEEHQRICEAGGLVTLFPGDCARVNGDLALSRALGDVRWKFPMQETPSMPPRYVLRPPPSSQPPSPARAPAHGRSIVSATPDVECVRLLPGDDLLLIACDGLWDVMESDDAVAFARARIERGIELAQVVQELVHVALARGSMDNVTVVLVRLGLPPPAEQARVAERAASLAVFGPAIPAGLDADSEDIGSR